ncbi:hypothetical protein HYPSUDRAFT_62399 [Hypholoma sublateritium FD-334 SS-4]|uniref:RING-type domain-containing protein n=1 Tax=Hypholoma sublateritium (strain FD-334 SS-4) TaxID=945553 RepID=A0A0D2Q8H0_HYPSF|nr:hypothetical protein HYPSUDRAFT_62399 [Hypholoma sublateritium FD-334 SS-4]
MPAGRSDESQRKRRSSRLKDRQVAATKALSVVQVSPTSAPRLKRRKIPDGSSDLPRGSSTVVDIPTATGAPPGRRLQRIKPAELERREKRLVQREQELSIRLGDLERRTSSLAKMEDETSMMMSQLAERETQTTLKQLEEHFTCPLCYEILAAPYSLNPSHCGHTFCAMCILKWFFSRLHRPCGGWHESVDCPICRSLLIITPESTPRLLLTFPFVPNRVTASVIESLVEKLVKPPLCSQAKIKREETDGTWASQSRKNRGRGCVRKREASEEKEDENVSDMPDVAAWREGGLMRAEWLKKDREGKKEMAYLLKYWSTMGSQDFVEMKLNLGV